MRDQRLHGGIEAVAFLELDREAFGQLARAYAGGVEALQDGQHGLDIGERRAELLGDLREIAGEVAGLVDHIDEILPDHAPRRIGDRERELLGEMIGERRLDRDEGFEIVVVVLAPARACARPFAIAHWGVRARARRVAPSASSVGRTLVEFGTGALGGAHAAFREAAVRPIGPAASSPGLRLRRWTHAGRHCPRLQPHRFAPAAGCARVRSRHRPRGRDWRAAAA